jgi:hypothetical protein
MALVVDSVLILLWALGHMPSKQQQTPRKKTPPFIGSRLVILVKQERRLNNTFWLLMSATQEGHFDHRQQPGEGKGFGHVGVGGSLPRSILVRALLFHIESKIHAICYCLIAQGPLNAFNH